MKRIKKYTMVEYLVRKISRAKWNPKPEDGIDSIQADAVTSDLRTNGNRLSFWKCFEENEDELQEALLALAGTLERPDKIDIAWLKTNDIVNESIEVEETTGITTIQDLQNRHVDVKNLDLQRICYLAKLLCKSIRDEEKFKRFSKKDILKILHNAIKKERLSLEMLPEAFSKELSPILKT